MEWTCESCTLEKAATSACCVACEAVRPARPCPSCTFVTAADVCEVCCQITTSAAPGVGSGKAHVAVPFSARNSGAAVSAANEPPAKTWQCSVCTLMNQLPLAECEACQTPKEVPGPPQLISQGGGLLQYEVTVPYGLEPGQVYFTTILEAQLPITVPAGLLPGRRVKLEVEVPQPASDSAPDTPMDPRGPEQAGSETLGSPGSGPEKGPETLESLLGRLSLAKWLSSFVANGVDDVATLRLLSDGDLEAMGMSLGHRRRLSAELNGEPQDAFPPAPLPSPLTGHSAPRSPLHWPFSPLSPPGLDPFPASPNSEAEDAGLQRNSVLRPFSEVCQIINIYINVDLYIHRRSREGVCQGK